MNASNIRECGKLYLIGLLLLLQTQIVSGQTAIPASYVPNRFSTIDGEEIYFHRPIMMMSFQDIYLVVLNSDPKEIWILNIDTMVGNKIGREGGGPGEYRAPELQSIEEDTLLITDDRTRIIRFLLPEGEHIDTTTHTHRSNIRSYIPCEDGSFFAVKRTYPEPEHGLFSLFSSQGDLIESYEEWDLCEEHRTGGMSLQRAWNAGKLLPINNEQFTFHFVAQPRMLLYTIDGKKLDDIHIMMPWYGRKGGADINPFWSEQFGNWMARPLWRSMHRCSEGFILTSYTETESIVAIYSESGTLVRYLSIPRGHFDEVGWEDALFDAVELRGRYWAMLYESEACIQEVIWK